MHATIFLILPDDAPDPNKMIHSLLEPYRWNEHAGGKQGDWYYWDYWYFFDLNTENAVYSYRDCYFLSNVAPDPNFAAGVITPDGSFHDWYSLPDQKSGQLKWNEVIDSLEIIESLENHMIVVIRIHS